MGNKRNRFAPKKYESKGFGDPNMTYIGRNGQKCSDSFCMIYESLLQSDAYADLTARQKNLYILCVSQHYGHRRPEKDFNDIPEVRGEDKFYLNWQAVHEQYRMYSENNHSRFYKDMKVLEEHGFISQITSGKSQHQKSIWKYTWEWQTWRKDSS